MPIRTAFALLTWLVVAAPLGGCANVPRSKPNVLILMIDTLRFDRLGAYGSTRNLTPFIDSLARRGHVFRQAYAQSSWTNPSVASLLTSRYQSQHRVFSFGSHLSEDELTLPEILQAAGYATGGFCANILVRSKNGFGQGFDRFELILQRAAKGAVKGRADAVHRAALAWLDEEHAAAGERQPIFLYLHYMEPHAPFDPPRELLDRLTKGSGPPDIDRINAWIKLPTIVQFTADMLQATEDVYDAEVMSLDAELRHLFGELEARGFLENTIVILIADHGEEFYEHGMVGHHQSLFEEVIRVPLIIVLPKGRRHDDVEDIVELTDVAPTLLEMLGVRRPPSFEGRVLGSVVDAERGSWLGLGRLWPRQRSGPRAAFSELIKAEETLRRTQHERAVILDGHKLIVGIDGEREYYDLRADPGEESPTSPDDGIRTRLDGAMEQLYADGNGGGPASTATSVDAETEERMRALGYTE
jgi:choline-sulfatase